MQASAVFDQEQPEQLWIGTDVRVAACWSATPTRVRPSSAGWPPCRPVTPQGYAQCFERYVADSYAAVDAYNGEGERPDGLPTFADGLRAAQICDAMLRSAASRSGCG